MLRLELLKIYFEDHQDLILHRHNINQPHLLVQNLAIFDLNHNTPPLYKVFFGGHKKNRDNSDVVPVGH